MGRWGDGAMHFKRSVNVQDIDVERGEMGVRMKDVEWAKRIRMVSQLACEELCVRFNVGGRYIGSGRNMHI